MPAKRSTMRKIREVFRLKFDCKLSNRKITKSCLIARSTVAEYLFRFQQAALRWPLPQDMDDIQLEQLLYPIPLQSPRDSRPLPNYDYIHAELRKKGVTLSLLWQEYKGQEPHGYQYSQFCNRYRQWAARIDPVMRQEHRAGEKMFVDYAGQTVSVNDTDNLKSTLIISQLPVDHLHEIIGDLTLADAILDRLIHHAYRINLKGESMRRKKMGLTENK